jgi:hypothetical protein
MRVRRAEPSEFTPRVRNDALPILRRPNAAGEASEFTSGVRYGRQRRIAASELTPGVNADRSMRDRRA